MDQQASEQAHTLFAQAFCVTLSNAVAAHAARQWQISEAEATPVAADESSIQYCLTFSGELAGSCFVVFDRAEAEVLAAPRDGAERDYSEVLAEILHQAADELASSLGGILGPFKVEVAHAIVTDPAAIRGPRLLAVNDEGSTCSVGLFFTADLSEALGADAGRSRSAAVPANLSLVMDVELNVTLRFGQRQLSLREILDLTSGSVVELDRQVDEAVELILDGRVIARGEAVIIDGNYGVRVTEVLESVGA